MALLAQALDRGVSWSPSFRNTRGFRAMPTPGGVPVVTTSPGFSVMKPLR